MVLELLRSLQPALAGIECETGFQRSAAFLRMWSRSDPARWTVIYTPGDGWFAFEVPGGFSQDNFDEDTSDDEVRSLPFVSG